LKASLAGDRRETMSEQEHESSSIEERLEALERRSSEHVSRCEYRSALRVASELRRYARSEQRVIAYCHACFTLMNHGDDILDPSSAREAAIECIGVLESNERALRIQPDLPEAEFAHLVSWLSACAYDNLATSTAQLNGYNSEGMHQCIADGMHVCRRTGKLQCITCFREYATDVYQAADDLDMSMHFARTGMTPPASGAQDRRWGSAKDLAFLLLLNGEIDEAIATFERAMELADSYHNPCHARLLTDIHLAEACGVAAKLQPAAGVPAANAASRAGSPSSTEPANGEWPFFELRRDQALAITHCVNGRYSEAIELLGGLDARLTQRRCLDLWFENRLRLLAAHRLSGDDRQLKRLALPLEAKARAARDWLTLRRLERLLDPAVPCAPFPLARALRAPLPANAKVAPGEPNVAAVAPPITAAESESAGAEVAPVVPTVSSAILERLAAANEAEDGGQAEYHAIHDEILAITPGSISSAEESAWLLHILRGLLHEDSPGPAVWAWAQSIAGPFRGDATVLSLLATLGASLRHGACQVSEELITDEALDRMFRESLDLDPTKERNFARAGQYFLHLENLGEAERCFARGSRLDRADGYLASRLADVYDRTDRTRDGLAVLDMCMREGCQDAEIPWKAATMAFGLEMFEASLAYLDHLPSEPGEYDWADYYRAAALLELDRPADALAAAESEAASLADCPFPAMLHRVSALAGLRRIDELRSGLREVLATPLASVDYLRGIAFARLFRRLWINARLALGDDPLVRQLEDGMLAAGAAPDEMFATAREGSEAVPGVRFFRCLVRQPLDDRWPNAIGCHAHETDWRQYELTWGVLAMSPEEAEQRVMAFQSRCYHLPAELRDLETDDEEYTDVPGVVWQGGREGGEEE
jgi:tetratricopeptide (TPR) repeat protein